MQRIPLHNTIAGLALIVIFAVTLALVGNIRTAQIDVLQQQQMQQYARSNDLIANILPSLPLSAEHVLVYDFAQDDVLFAKASDEPANLASLTKMISARIALDLPIARICIDVSDVSAIGDQGLMPGECFPIEHVVEAFLVSSSNDLVAAVDRTSQGFLSRSLDTYNEEHRTNFEFHDPSGWDFQDPSRQTLGSAEDVLVALHDLATFAPERITRTVTATYDLGSHELAHTYPAIEENADIRFLKTGYTDLAGGNIAAIVEPVEGHMIGIVLMESGFDERFDDFELIYSVLDSVYEFFEVL
jgi:D-alanyl-D-alanine carboxypeptidase